MWEHRKSISETDGSSARFTQRRKRGDWLERWQGRVTMRLEADPGLRCQGVSRLPLSSDGSRANALLELAPCSQLPRWMVWLGPRFSSGPRRSSFCENYLLDLSPHSLRQHTDAPLQFPPLALLPHSPLCPATNAAVRTERWGTARPHRPGKAPEARIPIAASLRTARASWASRFGGGEQLCSERRALATSSKGQGPDGGGGHGGQLRRLPSPPGAGCGLRSFLAISGISEILLWTFGSKCRAQQNRSQAASGRARGRVRPLPPPARLPLPSQERTELVLRPLPDFATCYC